MKRSLARVGLLLALSAALQTACASQRTELDQFRLDLEEGLSSGLEAVAGVRLGGFNHMTEVTFDGFHVIVISSLGSSHLLLFNGSGALIDRVQTAEVTAVHICRSSAESPYVITEQIDQSGSGVAGHWFHAYVVSDHLINEVWSGKAFEVLSVPGRVTEEGREDAGWISCIGGLQHAEVRTSADERVLEVSRYRVGLEGTELDKWEQFEIRPVGEVPETEVPGLEVP